MIAVMSRSTPATPDRPTAWTLTGDALVERRADGSLRLWGRWDRRFGCWDETGAPVTPDGPLLDYLGRWPDPAGERDDAWYLARAALAAYWSLVPTAVRLIAGDRRDGQWAALLGEWARRRE